METSSEEKEVKERERSKKILGKKIVRGVFICISGEG
jgi:hypothetical protein